MLSDRFRHYTMPIALACVTGQACNWKNAVEPNSQYKLTSSHAGWMHACWRFVLASYTGVVVQFAGKVRTRLLKGAKGLHRATSTTP